MSLHSSKGLSAKLVILASLIDPLVPFLKKDLPADQVESTIQEARRLFYVAITRCKSTGLPLILRTQLKRATIGEEVCHGKTEELFEGI
jgi:superfamily I DNA/RNA helicase